MSNLGVTRLAFSLPVLVALVALALLSACQRQPTRPALEQIAVLRFENLGADTSADWMGRAFSEIVTSELRGAPGLYAIPAARLHSIETGLGTRPSTAPGISAERAAAVAAGATRIAYGQYAVRGGTLTAQLTVEDELTGKMTVLNPVSGPAPEIVSAATSLAQQISTHLTPYGTKNPLVVEAHVNALEAVDSADLAGNLEKAIAADPNFGPNYRHLARFKLQQKDVAGAQDLIQKALARGNAIPDLERALIQLEDATLRNDVNARIAALTALAKAEPNDPDGWHDLGANAAATHRYPLAAEAYRKAVSIQPTDANFWNQLGYAAAFAGDAATAASAIDRYRKLLPTSPNPLDSFGDINLITGHLSDAAEYYRQNAQKNPAFYSGLDWLKAALARLMAGDVPGADTAAQQYFDARAAAKDPLIEYRKAQWAWISGRRKAACGQMAQVAHASEAAATRAVAVHAYAELAMWTLMLGDRQSASELARKATDLAAPGFAVQAALARILSQPPASPDEWKTRAWSLSRDPAQSSLANVVWADALLFSKEYSAALPILQTMDDGGNPSADEGLPVLLAWADVETGHIPEAAELLRSNPPLSDAGLTWSTPLYFPRIFYLRAVVAEKQNKPAEARENWRIFHALSGPDPMMWGEEQKGK